MTDLAQTPTRFARASLLLWLAAFALGLGIVAWKAPAISASMVGARPLHAPDMALFAAQSPAVQIHVAAALAAVLLGAGMLMSRKGARFHRIAGWTWAALMGGAAATSLFIPAFAPVQWSYIHIVTGWVLVLLPIGLVAARRHAVVVHRRSMLWLYFGFLAGAGAFAFIPGRLMWRLVFG